MNELKFKLFNYVSEINELKKTIDEISEEKVLERISFSERLKEVKEEYYNFVYSNKILVDINLKCDDMDHKEWELVCPECSKYFRSPLGWFDYDDMIDKSKEETIIQCNHCEKELSIIYVDYDFFVFKK